jgi:hypothetical protein
MEPENSISNSQELSTCPYPEADQSNPHHPTPPLLLSSPDVAKELFHPYFIGKVGRPKGEARNSYRMVLLISRTAIF